MQEFAVVKNIEMQALFRTIESNEKVGGGDLTPRMYDSPLCLTYEIPEGNCALLF
jgi:hypothetical protein